MNGWRFLTSILNKNIVYFINMILLIGDLFIIKIILLLFDIKLINLFPNILIEKANFLYKISYSGIWIYFLIILLYSFIKQHNSMHILLLHINIIGILAINILCAIYHSHVLYSIKVFVNAIYIPFLLILLFTEILKWKVLKSKKVLL